MWALGSVVEADRGSLPFALVHGEPLVGCATWALGEAGVTPVDVTTSWADVCSSGVPVVLHDALCPLTPVDFLHGCVAEALADGVVVVGVRPVTDTVRVQQDAGGPDDGAQPGAPDHGADAAPELGETLERDGLLAVASPVVLPPGLLASTGDDPGTDLAALVERLRAAGVAVRFREAPPEGRRVTDRADLEVLEALTRPEGPGPAAAPPG